MNIAEAILKYLKETEWIVFWDSGRNHRSDLRCVDRCRYEADHYEK